MNPDKASTLRLLKAGMGNPVHLLESRMESLSDVSQVEITARLEGGAPSHIPVLFLLSSLAFLEAQPVSDGSGGAGASDGLGVTDLSRSSSNDYFAEDGWTPADFLEYLRFDGGAMLLDLGEIRGREVSTQLSLSAAGELKIRTSGRGQSSTRWLSFVRGQSHIQPVS